VQLNKLDVLKGMTIDNYKKGIVKLKNKINFGLNDSALEAYDNLSSKVNKSSKTLEYEMSLFFDLKDKINKIGKKIIEVKKKIFKLIEKYRDRYTLKSNKKLMVDKTFVDFIAEKKKFKYKMKELEREKMKIKHNYDFKREMEYRKRVDQSLSLELIKLSENSMNSEVWQWGTKLKSLLKHK
jgi:hypothetical protein